MDSPAEPRDGVLVISAWVEPDTGDLRARIMHTTDPGSTEHEIRWVGSQSEVLGLVEEWLRGLVF